MKKNNRWKYAIGIILWILLAGYITAQSVYYYAWYGSPDSTLTHVYDDEKGEFSYYWQEQPNVASYWNALQEMWFVPTLAILIAVAYWIFLYVIAKQQEKGTISFLQAQKRRTIANVLAVMLTIVWGVCSFLLNNAMYIVATR